MNGSVCGLEVEKLFEIPYNRAGNEPALRRDGVKSVSIVEDSEKDARRLKKYVERYAEELGEIVEIHLHWDGLDFLKSYKLDADLVFLDIEMPLFNGLEVSQKLREIDRDVNIVFVTNMAQYALKGYKVGALDYIVKPVSYFSVADCMRRAFLNAPRRAKKRILLNLSATETVSVAAEDILYVEKHTNTLTFHTTRGVWEMRGTMRDVEAELEGEWFSRCISGCLVNLRFVERTTKNSVFVGGEELPLARQRRKEFINDLMNCVGGR